LMCSDAFVFVTSILIVLKPGELIDRVPYGCVLNTVKFPASSVAVRTEFPFASNSTDAFAIAAPEESETTPEILVSCCCANVFTTKKTTPQSAMVQRRLLVHDSSGPVLFFTVALMLE